MRRKPEYFIINKQRDFRQGFGGNVEEDGLEIKKHYFSRLFDSGEKGMRWYKLSLDYIQPVNSALRFTFYTFESDGLVFEGKAYTLTELIQSGLSDDKKLAALHSYKQLSLSANKEMLLTELYGRYLLFTVELTAADDDTARINSAKLYFRPYSMIQFLPEIYQTEENSFLERYIAIFQNLYEDMERTIEKSYENYTAENADNEFLQWLASWYCIQTVDLWNENQLRYLLKNAARIYGSLGTKDIIEEVCGLYIGERPEIVEYYQSEDESFVNKYSISRDRLFINPYVFTLIIPTAVLSAAELEKLYRIIDSCKPAHMDVNILMLAENKHRESYIGDGRLLDTDSLISLQDGIILTD